MKKILKAFLSIILTIGILFFLFRKINYDLIYLFKGLSISLLIVSLFLFFIIKVINTIRYSSVYSIAPSIKLFSLLSFSNLMLSIIPFRAGEFSYIKGLKKYFGISYSKSSIGLIGIRVIDYIIVYILFIFSSFFIGISNQNNLIGKISIFFTLSLISCLILVLVLIKIKSKIKNKKLMKIFNFFKEGIISFKKTPIKKFFIIFCTSISYWLLRIYLTYVIFIFLNIDLSFIKIIFVSLTLMLIGLFPIQTIGGFGIFEAGWTYFLILFGFTYEDILPKILIYHFLIFIPAIIFGIIGYMYLKLRINFINSNSSEIFN